MTTLLVIFSMANINSMTASTLSINITDLEPLFPTLSSTPKNMFTPQDSSTKSITTSKQELPSLIIPSPQDFESALSSPTANVPFTPIEKVKSSPLKSSIATSRRGTPFRVRFSDSSPSHTLEPSEIISLRQLSNSADIANQHQHRQSAKFSTPTSTLETARRITTPNSAFNDHYPLPRSTMDNAGGITINYIKTLAESLNSMLRYLLTEQKQGFSTAEAFAGMASSPHTPTAPIFTRSDVFPSNSSRLLNTKRQKYSVSDGVQDVTLLLFYRIWIHVLNALHYFFIRIADFSEATAQFVRK